MDMADIKYPEPPMAPDLSHLITEDDEPVDNRFSERQQRLLPHILFTSWEEGRPFEALADVGLFPTATNEDKVVPDFLLSLGVTPRPVTGAKENRSYLVWVYGKAPDLVIEVVSNKVGGELGEKLQKYTRIRVTYYAIYDPFCELSERELRLFRLDGGRYVEMANPRWLPEVGLGLTMWEGEFEGVHSRWLRFLDREGRLLATGEEKARSAEEKARSAEEVLEKSQRASVETVLEARFGRTPEESVWARVESHRLADLLGAAATVSTFEEWLALV